MRLGVEGVGARGVEDGERVLPVIPPVLLGAFVPTLDVGMRKAVIRLCEDVENRVPSRVSTGLRDMI